MGTMHINHILEIYNPTIKKLPKKGSLIIIIIEVEVRIVFVPV